MQVLYALKAWRESGDGRIQENIKEAQRQILQQIDQSGRIFVHLLYTLCEVARYADVDARQRASKYLRSKEDMNVSTKIMTNHLVLQLQGNEDFRNRVKEAHLASRTDRDIIKELYHRLTAAGPYKDYINKEEDNEFQDKKILVFLFNELLMEDEDFSQYMEDLYLQWQDDKDMMKMLLGNYLNKPAFFNFKQLVSHEKEGYAKELARTVIEKKEVCLGWIRPRLQNWDPDRVAVIDMLLLYMGVCEFLFFPSIPPKVTINEYIDLGKVYSTLQSGQFINGVLDNVLKDLQKNGKLNKTERAQK